MITFGMTAALSAILIPSHSGDQPVIRPGRRDPATIPLLGFRPIGRRNPDEPVLETICRRCCQALTIKVDRVPTPAQRCDRSNLNAAAGSVRQTVNPRRARRPSS